MDSKVPGRAEKAAITVSTWLASAAVYIARERGFFTDEGLDMTLDSYTSGHLALDAMLNGRAEFAVASEYPIARTALDAQPMRIIATLCEIDDAVVLIASRDRGISAHRDLRGKRVGVTAGSAAEFFLHIYLTISSIDPKDVPPIDIAPDHVVDAVMNGEVDAACTWTPHTLVFQDKLAGNAVVFSEAGLYTTMWNLITTKSQVEAAPRMVEQILRAIIKANRFIIEQPLDARAATCKYGGMVQPISDGKWDNYDFTAGLDQTLIINREDQARRLLERRADNIRKVPNFQDFICFDRLQTVEPGAITVAGRNVLTGNIR